MTIFLSKHKKTALLHLIFIGFDETKNVCLIFLEKKDLNRPCLVYCKKCVCWCVGRVCRCVGKGVEVCRKDVLCVGRLGWCVKECALCTYVMHTLTSQIKTNGKSNFLVLSSF